MTTKKIVRIGTSKTYGGRWYSIYCSIEYNDNRLSITGVEGPTPGGNALGSCGQIITCYKEYDDRGYQKLSDIKPAPGWNHAKIRKFFDVWNRWHLNDMNPGCEHQRALGWDKERIDPNKPATDYGKFYPGQSQDTWNLKGWVYPPYGYLTAPCPTCGYKYGTAWKYEAVPQDVLDWLFALPDADINPAWV